MKSKLIEKSKEYNFLRKASMFKGCIFNDDSCSNNIINAHSLSKSRVLSKISLDGYVIGIDFSKVPQDTCYFVKIGINKASIFHGFCGTHDNLIFKPIDDKHYSENNIEHEFLYAYRAFAMAYFERFSTYQFYKEWYHTELQKVKNNMTKLNELKRNIVAYHESLEILENYRNIFKNNYKKKRYWKINTSTIVIPQEYPIVASTMFYIEYDLYGNTINSYDNLNNLRPLYFTVFPQNGKTYIIFSYFQKDANIYSFIANQIKTKSVDLQKRIISNIILTNVENFYFSPKAWNKLNKEEQLKINQVYHKSIAGNNKKTLKLNLMHFKEFNLFIDNL